MNLCPRCGKRCPTDRQKFCSRACRTLACAEKNTYPCKVCEKPYIVSPSHRARGSLYCSKACGEKARSGENSHLWKGGPIAKTCVTCGKEFFVAPANADLKRCSNACRFADPTSKRQKEEPIFTSCAECGRQVQIIKCYVGKRKLCSRECAGAGHSKMMKGKGNGRYIHGEHALEYPAGWTRTLRAKIMKRDGNCCVLCHMTRAEHGKALCVHHIDYNKANISHANLLTVCRFCHGRMHGSLAQRKIWTTNLSALVRSRLSGVLPVELPCTTSIPAPITTILPPDF